MVLSIGEHRCAYCDRIATDGILDETGRVTFLCDDHRLDPAILEELAEETNTDSEERRP
jgi:hypothetical protein